MDDASLSDTAVRDCCVQHFSIEVALPTVCIRTRPEHSLKLRTQLFTCQWIVKLLVLQYPFQPLEVDELIDNR